MHRFVWLAALSWSIVGCGGGDPADEPGDTCAIIAGGAGDSSGAAEGTEATGVDDGSGTAGSQTQGGTPGVRLFPIAPLPGGVLDDAAMVALPGRKALLTGGFRMGNDPGPEAYLYDGVANEWTTVGPMGAARRDHAMVRLPDKRVLVAGGFDAANQALSTAEIFDPVTNTFTPTGDMTATRGFHSATLLDDGRVLIVGGLFGPGTAAEIYDPASGTFAVLAGNPGSERKPVKLGDGRVFLSGSPFDTATLFDPATDTFTDVGPMSSPHSFFQTATLLTDGRVLIAGGRGTGQQTAATDLFDPATNTFTAGPNMTLNRGQHVAVPLPGGRVLIAGGQDNGTVHDSAELYDPATNSFTLLPSMLPGPRLDLVGVALID